MTDHAQQVRDWAAQQPGDIDSNLLANVHATLAVHDVLAGIEARLGEIAGLLTPKPIVTITPRPAATVDLAWCAKRSPDGYPCTHDQDHGGPHSWGFATVTHTTPADSW